MLNRQKKPKKKTITYVAQGTEPVLFNVVQYEMLSVSGGMCLLGILMTVLPLHLAISFS